MIETYSDINDEVRQAVEFTSQLPDEGVRLDPNKVVYILNAVDDIQQTVGKGSVTAEELKQIWRTADFIAQTLEPALRTYDALQEEL
jgi:hypothetical protein